MIRTTALWLVILGLLGYSWKDWYKALCGLILLIGVAEHPDFPKSVFGIPGFNPFNLLLFNILLAWAVQRRKEGLRLDLPRHITVFLLLFLGVVLVGFARIIGDTSILTLYYREGMTYYLNEYLVNTIKWVIPPLLLYDGCRSEERFRFAIFSILAVFVLFAFQVAKWMPPSYALNADALERRSLKVLVNGMGYHRVNLSAMLSGASWAILCTAPLVPKGLRWGVLLLGLFVIYAQMMTGGRAGYGAWVAVGLALSALKWRRYLLLIPVAGALAVVLAPGVVGRATMGFTADSHDTNRRLEEETRAQETSVTAEVEVDSYTVTAGRSVAWPLVIEKIREGPWVGFGRQGMLRTGVATYLYDTYGEIFPHPHNAYLEMLLDNGIVGFLIVVPFHVLLLLYSVRLFLDRQSASCAAIGGVSAALLLGLLVSSMGSQSFYPREGWMCMWAAMFVMLRVRVERRRKLAQSCAAPAPVRPSVIRSQWQLRPASVPVEITPRSPHPRLATAGPSPRQPVGRPLPRSKPSGSRAAGASTIRRPSVREQSGGFFRSGTVQDTLVWEHA